MSTLTESVDGVAWSLKKSWETTAPEEQFWVAVDIFVNRPHIINRRLMGSEVLGELPIKSYKCFDELKRLLFGFKSDLEIHELITKENNDLSNQTGLLSHKVAFVKKVLPKHASLQPSLEIVLKGKCDVLKYSMYLS